MGDAKKTRNAEGSALPVVHRHAAGIDIGSTFHMVAVRGDVDPEPVRRFESFTGDLYRMADWLTQAGVTTVAMESTGVYWIPAFEILEARGFEVLLVNARDVKNVPGRKTDVNDAQWIQRLHEYGLLRGSFRPRQQVATLRAFVRHRERLVEFAATTVQHMQKALMQMNVQLHVVSDMTGATGLRILRAIVAGEREPPCLPACATSAVRPRSRPFVRRSRGPIGPSMCSPSSSPSNCTTSTRRRSAAATTRSRRRCAIWTTPPPVTPALRPNARPARRNRPQKNE